VSQYVFVAIAMPNQRPYGILDNKLMIKGIIKVENKTGTRAGAIRIQQLLGAGMAIDSIDRIKDTVCAQQSGRSRTSSKSSIGATDKKRKPHPNLPHSALSAIERFC
jgi:hypothetical protein